MDAEPDITTRARRVLVDLSEYLRTYAATLLNDTDTEYALPIREARPYEAAGLVEVLTSRRASKMWRVRCTDLGREVHRLATEGATTP